METFAELILDMARELRYGGITEGTSTAATTTSITDATIPNPVGTFDGGTIWLLDESPIVTRIIDTHTAGGVISWTSAVAGLTGAQAYALFGPRIPRPALRDALNRALKNIGQFDSYATIDSVALQEDYDIAVDPTPAVTGRVMQVWQSAYPDPATLTEQAWRLHQQWEAFGDTLRFLANPPAIDGTANLRLGFNIFHPTLTDDDDEIRREVEPRRLVFEAVAEAYLSLIAPRNSTASDEEFQNLFNRALDMANQHPEHGNKPLPPPQLLMGVGQSGGQGVHPDLLT